MPQLARTFRFARRLLLLAGGLALAGPVGAQRPAGAPAPPPALPPALASLESFDPRGVQLNWHDRHWLLVHQGRTLKDFGPRVEDARFALRLVQELGLNQHGVIGSPAPHLEYWLADGHAPGPLPRRGMQAFPIDPDRLRVEEVQGQWCVRDAERVYFNFARYADEAREAVAVLQKYHFTEVGFVGPGAPTMIVFGGNGKGDRPAQPSRIVADGGRKGKTGPPAQGYAGIVQALVPPLLAPPVVRVTPPGELPTLGGLHAAAWHSPPHFGPQTLAPSAAPAVLEDRRAFDWRQAQVRQEGAAWKLAVGSQVLAGFGADLHQAQAALSAIRYYRFTEVRAGGDCPAYFLANGASPRGLTLGLRGEELQPDKLDVRRLAEGYAVCQGARVVLQFRDRQEPALQALEAIQRQKLDRVCRLGPQGGGGVTILVRSR